MDTLYKILDLLWKSGLSETEFCQKAGINRSAVTDWKKGKTKSYKKHLSKIAEVLDTDVEYLLGSEDVATESSLTEAKSALLEKYDQLSAEQQKDVLRYMEFLLSKDF